MTQQRHVRCVSPDSDISTEAQYCHAGPTCRARPERSTHLRDGQLQSNVHMPDSVLLSFCIHTFEK
jgi:hypothetical protein